MNFYRGLSDSLSNSESRRYIKTLYKNLIVVCVKGYRERDRYTYTKKDKKIEFDKSRCVMYLYLVLVKNMVLWSQAWLPHLE